MEKKSLKGWLYLLPALLFLGVFLVYPLVDVFIYSFEEGFNFASQTSFGVGGYNYSYVLHDPYFLQAVKNTFILVVITVPLSTGIALLSEAGGNSRLHYVYDVGDTYHPDRHPFSLWEIGPAFEGEIIEALENRFGNLSSKDSLSVATMFACMTAVEENLTD